MKTILKLLGGIHSNYWGGIYPPSPPGSAPLLLCFYLFIRQIISFNNKAQNIYCDVFISGKIFQQEKIHRFVKFVVFWYILSWMTASVSSSAPKNDQLFKNSLFDYKTIDNVIANEALRRFGNHMWYLREELGNGKEIVEF